MEALKNDDRLKKLAVAAFYVHKKPVFSCHNNKKINFKFMKYN